MLGKLIVEVIEASDVVAKDLFKSDPYALVNVDSQSFKTQVIKSTLKPKWNESFAFFVANQNSELKVVLYDAEKSGKDQFMGQVIIPVTAFINKGKVDQWHELQKTPGGKEKVKGSLHIACQFDAENSVKDEIKALDDDLKQSLTRQEEYCRDLRNKAMLLDEKYSKELSFLRTQLGVERNNLAIANEALGKANSDKYALDETVLFERESKNNLQLERDKLLKETRMYMGEELPSTLKELQNIEKVMRASLTKLESKKESLLKEHKMCMLCNDTIRSIAFTPCGHVCVCEQCGQREKECPICKMPIQQKIKVVV